jgi:spermidine synthase
MSMTRRLFGLGFAGVTLAGGTAFAQAGSNVIDRAESPYNTIFVMRDGQYISMIFGVNRRLFTESKWNPNDPTEMPVTYTRFMSVALAYAPALRSMVQIGLGGARTSSYLNQFVPQMRVEAVELDPEVIRLARQHFGLRTNATLNVHAQDGRMYLRGSRATHDLIFVDAYRGTFVPFHLLTKEFFQLAKSRLNPGGVLAQNIEPNTMLYPAAIATLKSVFTNVDTFEADGNIVAVAYDGPSRRMSALQERANALQARHNFRYPIAPMLVRRRVETVPAGAQVLRDDFAPVESLRAIENHNRPQRQ